MRALRVEEEIRDECFLTGEGKIEELGTPRRRLMQGGGGLALELSSSGRGEGGGSWGRGDWDEGPVDFSGHHSCPEVFGFTLA